MDFAVQVKIVIFALKIADAMEMKFVIMENVKLVLLHAATEFAVIVKTVLSVQQIVIVDLDRLA
jgi:site-specific DNA-cytosine methylase